ncbi:MAG: hypothetical protein ABIQ64_03560 [Candidatus Saccharimonadales bacterium]
MQPQPLNPFPVSDDKSASPPAPVVPMPQVKSQESSSLKPVAPSVFVQPVSPYTHQSSIKPKGPTAKIETLLVSLLSKPVIQLPDYMKDMAARMLPWLTIMMSVIVAPLVVVGLAMGGFLGFLTSFYDINTNPFYWITVVLLITQLILMITAVPRLLRESRRGWYLLFLASLFGIVTLITNIFAQFVAPITALLIGLVVFTLILYVLFQTRSYYTN